MNRKPRTQLRSNPENNALVPAALAPNIGALSVRFLEKSVYIVVMMRRIVISDLDQALYILFFEK